MDERIVRKSLEILHRRSLIARWPVGPWQVREADYRPDGAYEYLGPWRELAPHETFAALRTVFARATFTCPLPTSPEGQLYLSAPRIVGVEGLWRVDGAAYAGLDVNHTRVAAPEGEHALELEFVSWLRAMCQPELRAERASLGPVEMIEVQPQLEAAWYDLSVVADALPYISDERRRGRLAMALEEALLAIDLTLSADELLLAVENARWLLQERLAAIQPDPEAGTVCLVGHTHIDTAWLWPLSETVRKCGRTFSTAARLMERYPHYRFSCSQPQLYAYTKAHYPALYEQIKEWVATGRWETTGAMWVETDCNVPSGESLIRQISHGLRFFQEEFGTRPCACWLPDVFGYPASLPGILQGCGVPYFMTCKLHWQSSNPVPHHLFWWEGIDGSQVLTHIPRLKRYYNGTATPEELRFAWEQFTEKANYDEVMLPFGFGDGGGGVTAEMLEYVQRQLPGLPATRLGTGEAYFDRVADLEPDLATWQGELYLETHRGTYTTQSRTKRANRKSEIALGEAELFGALAQLAGAELDMAELDGVWKQVLVQQFHDILPGSSIGQVYEDALQDYDQAQQVAWQTKTAALKALTADAPAGTVVVHNSLNWERSDPVEAVLPDPGELFHLHDSLGRACEVQVLDQGDGLVRMLFEPVAVPPLGWEAFTVQSGASGYVGQVAAWERGLENAMFRLELDDEGQIVRLLDKRAGREVVSPEAPANLWQMFQDGPEREAAWNVHDTFEKRVYPLEEPATITVVETGPVRATLLVERPYRGSYLSVRISLYRHTPRIDFVADVDWQERQTMLKIGFPVQVRSPQATYEVQFGAVERPTHRNTSWDETKFEVCAHRWIDLSESGYGVSLLNDSRYGHDVKGNMLRLTALRGPEYPDPEADRGMHRFTYALYPHAQDWRAADTVRRGLELNVPMTPAVGQGAGMTTRCQYLSVEGEGVVMSAFKPADDGAGYILRCYEAHGGRTQAMICCKTPPSQVWATDLVEQDQEQIAVQDGAFAFSLSPFEIKTFRLRW